MSDSQDDVRRAQLALSWSENAEAWTEAVRTGAIASRRVGTDRAVVAAVRAHDPRRVLDVGCGEGWLARALAGAGIDVVGVDGAAPLVEAARRGGGGTFHLASFDDLAAGTVALGAPFDVVVLNFALLADDHAPHLRALGGWLTPGGVVVIQTIHPWSGRGDGAYTDGWRTETFGAFGGRFPAAMPWYYRTMASWVRLLQASGLRLTDLAEPADPERGLPLSLVLTAAPE